MGTIPIATFSTRTFTTNPVSWTTKYVSPFISLANLRLWNSNTRKAFQQETISEQRLALTKHIKHFTICSLVDGGRRGEDCCLKKNQHYTMKNIYWTSAQTREKCKGTGVLMHSCIWHILGLRCIMLLHAHLSFTYYSRRMINCSKLQFGCGVGVDILLCLLNPHRRKKKKDYGNRKREGVGFCIVINSTLSFKQ